MRKLLLNLLLMHEDIGRSEFTFHAIPLFSIQNHNIENDTSQWII
jgi:hypothetical protein